MSALAGGHFWNGARHAAQGDRAVVWVEYNEESALLTQALRSRGVKVAEITAEISPLASLTFSNGTKKMPSAKRGWAAGRVTICSAAFSASRVLPIPPKPVSVSSRTCGSANMRCRSASSRSSGDRYTRPLSPTGGAVEAFGSCASACDAARAGVGSISDSTSINAAAASAPAVH